ncbi:MAG: hypothetical protein MUQ27_07970 [Acidimicrobiia bacterium]|nr:hypothetical protein [Acidimicrobiia bacterium]
MVSNVDRNVLGAPPPGIPGLNGHRGGDTTDRERTHEVRQRRRTADRRITSPAQIVAGLIGVILVVMGGVVLARVGLASLTGDITAVLGIGHTALMGLIDVVAGLLFLGAAASSGVRGNLIGLSLLAVAFGAVVAIEPAAFDSTLLLVEAVSWTSST